MRKSFYILFVCVFICSLGMTQEEGRPPLQQTDTIINSIQKDNLVIIDSSITKKKEINPLAPSRAALFSTVLPGAGQLYNRRYWKAPIVWGALGGSIYAYSWNNNNYKRFRTAFKRRQAGFIDDEFYDLNGDNVEGQEPDLDVDDLENQQERFQEDRDLWLVVSIALYALNIVDANVDAHLKQFNIDDNLSFDFQPYMDLNQTSNTPIYGMALTIKF